MSDCSSANQFFELRAATARSCGVKRAAQVFNGVFAARTGRPRAAAAHDLWSAAAAAAAVFCCGVLQPVQEAPQLVQPGRRRHSQAHERSQWQPRRLRPGLCVHGGMNRCQPGLQLLVSCSIMAAPLDEQPWKSASDVHRQCAKLCAQRNGSDASILLLCIFKQQHLTAGLATQASVWQPAQALQVV